MLASSVAVFQIGIKFTNEPPQGIMAGLKRTYQTITQDVIEQCAVPQYRPMLYTISFLHSIVQVCQCLGFARFFHFAWYVHDFCNSLDIFCILQSSKLWVYYIFLNLLAKQCPHYININLNLLILEFHWSVHFRFSNSLEFLSGFL